MRQVNKQVLNGADTGTIDGIQIDSNQLVSASFQAVFGDTSAVGVVKLQASNDIYQDRYQPGNFTVVNWTDIPNQTASITGGVSALLTVPQMSYRWVRVVYTAASGGSSTLVVNMFALSV